MQGLRGRGVPPEVLAVGLDAADQGQAKVRDERAPAFNAVDGVRRGAMPAFEEKGSIALTPWPLGVPELSGIMFAYRAKDYPEVLDPVVAPYRVVS